MNKQLHLNACYHLMIACGLNERQAMTVAGSNYAVDCATDRGIMWALKDNIISTFQKKAVTAYKTKELWKAVTNNEEANDKILCFHFNTVPIDMLCGEAMKAYNEYNFYKLGILLHVIMDKASHEGFTRKASSTNNVQLRVKGESNIKHWLLDKVRWMWTKPVGHSEAIHYPDRYNAKWSRNGGKTWKNNRYIFSGSLWYIADILYGNAHFISFDCIDAWVDSKVDNNVDYILDHHEWHSSAREVREFILNNEQ